MASLAVGSTVTQRTDRIAGLCALVLLFEGYDIASVGYAVPSLVDAWKLSPSAFTQVLTAGSVGLMLGSLVAGLLGDRLGRKPVLMSCVFLFGAFSLISAFAGSPISLMALRFLTGLGLGGGLPTVLALASDVAPSSAPERFVTLLNVGVPIGFSAGGFLASWLVRTFGWPAIFVLGGMLPLCVLPLVALWLPESIRHNPAPHGKSLVWLLFQNGLARTTFLLWSINALSYLNVYFMLLWIPALLHSTGVDPARAIFGTTLFGIGGVVSPVLAALVASRFGLSRVLTFGLMVGALCLLLIGLLHPDFWLLALMLCGAGVGGGCQGGINSLSALSYPHSARSTGAGWALGVGRVGTIAGPLLGGQLLSLGVGAQKIFATASIPVFAAAMLVAFLDRVGVGPLNRSERQEKHFPRG